MIKELQFYAEQSITITVPANDVAFATFPYSDLPPGDARLLVTLEVIVSIHEDSDEDAVLTIQFTWQTKMVNLIGW